MEKSMSFTVTKTKAGHKITLWEALSYCHKRECLIAHLCPYINGANGRCEVERRYIQAAFNSVVIANKNDLTETEIHHAGTILLPLYTHLVKFKIVELSLKSPLLDKKDKNDVPIIHPIYREIRSTIKDIHTIWSSLLGPKFRKSPVGNDGDLIEHGDPNYADNLYVSEKKKKK
jgi:hypothetical protein